MLEFADVGFENVVNVYEKGGKRCLCQLLRLKGVWGIQNLIFRIEDTHLLRQIADKLDEMNKK